MLFVLFGNLAHHLPFHSPGTSAQNALNDYFVPERMKSGASIISSLLSSCWTLCLLGLGASLYTLAAPPYGWSWAGWVALAPLLIAIRDKSFWAAVGAGIAYGILFGFGITHWSYPTVVAFFSFSPFLSVLVIPLIYALFVGPYVGFFAGLASKLMQSRFATLTWIGVPALWVSAEFCRARLSGFAWELLGYTQYNHSHAYPDH